jgi:hypothetical protein
VTCPAVEELFIPSRGIAQTNDCDCRALVLRIRVKDRQDAMTRIRSLPRQPHQIVGTLRPPISSSASMSLRQVSRLHIPHGRLKTQAIRLYHSANHPKPPSYTPLQHKILSSALALVPSKGFTAETVSEGAKQAGYLEITHNLFPRGAWALVEYHLVTQREKLAGVPLENTTGVSKAIRKLCVERLKGNKDIIGRWQEVCLITFIS